ncbi:MAG: glycosyltransferase [Candidatus Omnitrophota bacterium]
MITKYAPIALFVYNRPWHLRQTVESLIKNTLAKESELIIFSDAAKDKKSEAGVQAVRDYLKTISGFKKVLIHNRKINFSPSKNIIEGVTKVINEYGKIIVLEDDLSVAPYFLDFMNDALLFYENEPKIISVCGYMYPVKIKNRQTLLLRMADCWGWGTWKRGWDLFDPNAKKLLEQLKSKKLIRKFDLDGRYPYSKALKKQASERTFSWATCWYASSLLNDKLSLYPSKSLVRNVGFDGSGVNCGFNTGYDVNTLQEKAGVFKIPLKEDQDTINKIGVFFRINKFKRLVYFIHKIFFQHLKRDKALRLLINDTISTLP